jgi:hypothetical protein
MASLIVRDVTLLQCMLHHGVALVRGSIESHEVPQLEPSPLLPEGTRSEALLDALPGKKPLIKLSYRPPKYETPVEYFRSRGQSAFGLVER